jgi:putative heme iron utilization protein
MRQYCKYFLHLDVSTLAMVGVDCDGFDIRADGQLLRFHFSTLVLDAKQARVALIELSHKSQYK